MRSLSAATAVALGSLALAVPASSAATPKSTFVSRAGAMCQSYLRTAKSDDAAISGRLGAHPSSAAQILVTAELLYTNATLSLATEARLATLTAPALDRTLWAAMLESDRTGGLLTLETSEVLAKLVLSESAANTAVSTYDSAYEKVEAGWNAGVKLLRITGCE
jgi:hypothetical protein